MDNALKQVLIAQGYSDENIQKINDVLIHPEAYRHAMRTGDFEKAYGMTQQDSKPFILSEWFSEFCKANPKDADELSKYLFKFSRWTQSQVDKNKSS